jgi:N-acetylglucosamine kinase-like BadF-type ATPase
MAAFAPQVVRLADGGDSAALDILERGAVLLAEMVAANHRMLPTGPGPEVVITGGLGTACSLYRGKIVKAIQERLPAANVQSPAVAPAMGAALLAMQQVGQPVSVELIENLMRFTP